MRCYDRYENGRLFPTYYRSEDERLIEGLTNWQRKQWGKAGHPRDAASIKRFARLQRDGTELHQGDILPPAT